MKLIKIGAAVLNQTPMDWVNNKRNILNTIEEARSEGVTVLCLPELCITGYGCEDMFYSDDLIRRGIRILHEILPYTKGMVVGLGLPLRYQNRIFNAAALITDGEIAGFVAKQFLAGSGIHYEPRWFTPWPAGKSVQLELENETGGEKRSYPLGDIFFDVGGVKMGFEICEDAWVANRPARRLYHHGADLILNPSASHFAFDKLEVRKQFVLEGSRAFGVGYLYANHLGNEAGRAIYDGGALIASSGKMVAVGSRLTFDDYRLTSAVIDIEEARMMQAQAATIFNVPEVAPNFIKCDFSFPEIDPEPPKNKERSWEHSEDKKEEEFSRALALGLFDYLRKSYSQGFVISLSGGADSAAVLSCCHLMLKLGEEYIGLERLKQKLAHIREIQDCKSSEEIAEKLILTAYQGTKNSSETTRRAAEEIARATNARFLELSVDGIVNGYHQLIEGAIGRNLSWEKDDIALQNIQARVRAPSVWMLANIEYKLLLSTSNRSEAAVGYATMDGDTSGGLSPIAGIDKAFLRQWLRWLEHSGPDGKYKIPALSFINDQQPTAELRPQESGQTDEDDLMPYDLLDAIEAAAIGQRKSPVQCFKLMQQAFPGYDKEQLREWVARFFRLWSRNQWKRERYAPSFHLDDKNLDPKTWCRFPILSGAFGVEIQELLEE